MLKFQVLLTYASASSSAAGEHCHSYGAQWGMKPMAWALALGSWSSTLISFSGFLVPSDVSGGKLQSQRSHAMLFYFTLWECSHQPLTQDKSLLERVVRARGTRLRQGAACYASLCRGPDFQLKVEDRSPSILPTAFQSLASETGISSTVHSFLYFWPRLRAFGCVKSNRLACTHIWWKWQCWTKSSVQWGLSHISSAKVMRWHEVSKNVAIPRPGNGFG